METASFSFTPLEKEKIQWTSPTLLPIKCIYDIQIQCNEVMPKFAKKRILNYNLQQLYTKKSYPFGTAL
jgi:hypothetical protein